MATRQSKRKRRDRRDRLSDREEMPRLYNEIWCDVHDCRFCSATSRLQAASLHQIEELRAYRGGYLIGTAMKATKGNWSASKLAALYSFIQLYLQLGLPPDPLVDDQVHHTPALCIAAYDQHADVLLLLLEHGARLDVVDRSGFPPDFCALQNGSLTELRLLLEAGATSIIHGINIGQPAGSPPEAPRMMTGLLMAVERRNEAALELLRQHGAQLSDWDFEVLCKGYPKPSINEKWLMKRAGGMHCCRESLWSFPSTDRHTINLLTAHARRSNQTDPAGVPCLPVELWLRILSSTERGWFKGRGYLTRGRPLTNVLTQNIVTE